MGGNILRIPLSVSIVVETRKKIRSRKAISAMDPALISCISRFAIIIYVFNTRRQSY
jgi:hypothetical protein